jgi:hypothetical protein
MLWAAGYSVESHLEGRLGIGARTNMLVGVYDCSPVKGKPGSNGRFNDYCIDRLRLDLDGDGRLNRRTEDFPLSRVITVDDRIWKLELDPGGYDLRLQPCSLPLGRLKPEGNWVADGALEWAKTELVNTNRGWAFRRELQPGRVLSLPAGRYSITAGRLRARSRGWRSRSWEALFSVAGPITLTADRETALRLGAPFRLEPQVDGKPLPGEKLSIIPQITGAGGEEYHEAAPARRRMLPSVRITDSLGVVVSKGNMEYG